MSRRLIRSRPDEGYSEDNMDNGPDDCDANMDADVEDDRAASHADYLLDLPPAEAVISVARNLPSEEQILILATLLKNLPRSQRDDIAKFALDQLATSSLAKIIDSFYSRLHLDPILQLPTELTEIVMQQLGPSEVLRCAALSRQWRSRAVDTRLWNMLYLREGWKVDLDAIKAATRVARPSTTSGRKHELSTDGLQSSKRQREGGESSITANASGDALGWNVQHGVVEADGETPMEGVESSSGGLLHPDGSQPRSTHISDDDSSDERGRPRLDEATLRRHDEQYQPGLHPPLVPQLYTDRTRTQIDWLYLYKQRCRLESNWNAGRYRFFRLPKPEHPEDAHKECVYTIQFVGRWLVSGSRDATIKIWNLDTERCERTLSGQHDLSVLCLQFDPKADIIVSGGSDSFVVIWKFSTGEVIKKMTTAHQESVLNLRFDDRYLITCSKDHSIKMWNRHAIRSDDTMIPDTWRDRFMAEPVRELPPYSLIATFEGHGAAVNSIHIHGDKIVSASGDRTVRMWSISTGLYIREFAGHHKGIACVQYDGRRIISGSSDATVKVFDTKAVEVACLTGHKHLVRTVQARFGDSLMTDEELEELAKETQEKWAKQLNVRSDDATSSRYALTHRAVDRSLGAKLPYGGGGSKWCRIVSGSYDETVVIWKKDAAGRWKVSRRLFQTEALHGTRTGPRQLDFLADRARQQATDPLPAVAPGRQARAGMAAPAQTDQPGPAVPQDQQHIVPPTPGQPVLPAQAPAALALARSQGRRPRQAALVATTTADEAGNNHRVFKLQFDPRRIVCCSQNKTIVGWDFADDDEDIKAASAFFAETD